MDVSFSDGDLVYFEKDLRKVSYSAINDCGEIITGPKSLLLDEEFENPIVRMNNGDYISITPFTRLSLNPYSNKKINWEFIPDDLKQVREKIASSNRLSTLEDLIRLNKYYGPTKVEEILDIGFPFVCKRPLELLISEIDNRDGTSSFMWTLPKKLSDASGISLEIFINEGKTYEESFKSGITYFWDLIALYLISKSENDERRIRLFHSEGEFLYNEGYVEVNGKVPKKDLVKILKSEIAKEKPIEEKKSIKRKLKVKGKDFSPITFEIEKFEFFSLFPAFFMKSDELKIYVEGKNLKECYNRAVDMINFQYFDLSQIGVNRTQQQQQKFEKLENYRNGIANVVNFNQI